MTHRVRLLVWQRDADALSAHINCDVSWVKTGIATGAGDCDHYRLRWLALECHAVLQRTTRGCARRCLCLGLVAGLYTAGRCLHA